MSETNRHQAQFGEHSAKRNMVREVALTVGALAGLFCVTVAALALLFGVTPLVFRSGSMAPAIDTGALAISKETPATAVSVGDIVNVTNAAGSRITHRVVEIGAVGTDSAQLYLQGDANAERDAEAYIVSEVGRVVASVPKLGYAVSWLSGPVAVFVGGVLVGVLLMVAWSPRGIVKKREAADLHDPNSSGGRHIKAPLTVLLAIAAVGTVGLSAAHTPTTLAQLGDTSTAASGEFRTVLQRPASFSCTNTVAGLTGARLSWPNVNTAYSYRLDFTPAVDGVTNPVILNPSTATTRTYQPAATLLMVGNRTFTLRAFLGDFVSPSAGTWTINFTTALLTSCVSSTPAPTSSTSGVSARSAPQAIAPESTAPAPTESSLVPAPTAEPTTSSPTTTSPGVLEPSTTTPSISTPSTTTPSTTTDTPAAAPASLPTETTTTPPSPAVVSGPVVSPSGASTAQVVDIDGSPTLQIVDTAGNVQYSAPATSSEAYGYGVNWSAGDQLWLLGPDQLVRLDASGGSWSRTVVDPAATDDVPAEILALLQ